MRRSLISLNGVVLTVDTADGKVQKRQFNSGAYQFRQKGAENMAFV